MSNRADFVLIAPEFTFVDSEGKMATPCYLRPVTPKAQDFIDMAYAMHKRGLGNSLVLDNIEAYAQALDGIFKLGMMVEEL